MRRVALKIAYIGSKFHGYQRQPNYRTVEGELLKTLQELEIIEDTWSAHYSVAGRTDKGVHSTGNVVSFITDSDIHINQVNGELPRDIKIIGTSPVPYGFKVRFPEKRVYTYIQPIDPFRDDTLDIEKIRQAMEYFLGEHNYRNFSKRNEKNPMRTIKSIQLEEKNNLLIFKVDGVSFLWNMVRKIITSLMMVGYGELELEDIRKLLTEEELRQYIRLRPAPANGLILSDVEYKNITFDEKQYAKKKLINTLMDEYRHNQQEMMADHTLMEILGK
ncbi:MAG: tRNA pseudouridine(38-40) synthase TruA [Methanosphaera sp.]|nr:tRNA pseudouridine(38-40) synthase TruA [Methanosphaera sp.]